MKPNGPPPSLVLLIALALPVLFLFVSTGNVQAQTAEEDKKMAAEYAKKGIDAKSIEKLMTRNKLDEKRAMKQGPDAQYNLAAVILQDDPVRVTRAAFLLRKSADAGRMKAQRDLGKLYMTGTGVQQSWTEAMNWWQKAAAAGDAQANFLVGSTYATGQGPIKKNMAQALKYLEPSASKGYPPAQFDLGLMYYTGEGVGLDKPKGIELLKKAAEHGSDEARRALLKIGLTK